MTKRMLQTSIICFTSMHPASAQALVQSPIPFQALAPAPAPLRDQAKAPTLARAPAKPGATEKRSARLLKATRLQWGQRSPLLHGSNISCTIWVRARPGLRSQTPRPSVVKASDPHRKASSLTVRRGHIGSTCPAPRAGLCLSGCCFRVRTRAQSSSLTTQVCRILRSRTALRMWPLRP